MSAFIFSSLDISMRLCAFCHKPIGSANFNWQPPFPIVHSRCDDEHRSAAAQNDDKQGVR
jgi:hypothetical protein